MREKKIRFGKLKIRLFESSVMVMVHFNFGRHKKGRKIDTRTLYDAIAEGHKLSTDEIWLDIQDKKAIGMNITLAK